MTAFSKISYLTDSKRVALLLMPACEWSCHHQRTFDVKDNVDSVGRNHISTVVLSEGTVTHDSILLALRFLSLLSRL